MRSNHPYMNLRNGPDTPLHPARRRYLGWAGAALITPLVAACSAPVSPMRVGSIVFPGYEGLFLAREYGYLDVHRVRLVEMLANTDTLRSLAVEQLEAAAMTLDDTAVLCGPGTMEGKLREELKILIQEKNR